MTDKYKYLCFKTYFLAKNFYPDECALLVDLVQENKPKLSGLSILLSPVKRNYNIGRHSTAIIRGLRITESSKNYLAKKWSNILAKYKPIISDKIISIRKLGVVHLKRI